MTHIIDWRERRRWLTNVYGLSVVDDGHRLVIYQLMKQQIEQQTNEVFDGATNII